MTTPHRAVEFVVNDGGVQRRECRSCGGQIVGFGAFLRHLNEVVTIEHPDRRDAETFTRAVEVVTSVLGGDGQQARAVVQALYADGLLRRRRAPVPA